MPGVSFKPEGNPLECRGKWLAWKRKTPLSLHYHSLYFVDFYYLSKNEIIKKTKKIRKRLEAYRKILIILTFV